MSYALNIDICKLLIVSIFITLLNADVHYPLHYFGTILGVQGEGFHSGIIPIGDIIFTVICAYLFHKYTRFDYTLGFKCVWLFFLGQFLHYVFGVNTRLFNYLNIRFTESAYGSVN
jgi:hypothetical protein